MYKLLIVEDDMILSETMKSMLDKWGFNCYIANNFENILNEFIEVSPEIVLMDINIPAFDGFYWCKKIRDVSKIPIIFVSSRDSNFDIIMAMNNGGDDFIQKPFDMGVLVAKIQAIMRRTYEYIDSNNNILKCDELVLNINDTTVHYKNNELELTKNEFKILKLLMENKGKVVSREDIMKKLWDDDVYVNENTLTVNINRLRKKLEDIDIKDLINTKKGMGYIIS